MGRGEIIQTNTDSESDLSVLSRKQTSSVRVYEILTEFKG